MIFDTTVHNLVAGSAQLALIVTIAALLQWIVRVDAAGVRYFYWRAIAALCVVLPWIQSLPAAGRTGSPRRDRDRGDRRGRRDRGGGRFDRPHRLGRHS